MTCRVVHSTPIDLLALIAGENDGCIQQRTTFSPHRPHPAVISFAHPRMKTFAELFCLHYGTEPEHYARTALRMTLHRRALVLAPLLGLFAPDHFACDLNFLRCVGELHRPADLLDEIRYFYWHPWNQGFLRRNLRLRVSAARVTRLVRVIMPEESPSPEPWARLPAGTKRAARSTR
jgi:hypothetical protein